MQVPLVDSRASLAPIRDELRAEWDTILDGMHLFLGPNVQAFEREFSDYCDVEFGIGVSTGTDALSVALRALGVGAGDEVIVPSLTFFASIEAIVHVGATPVLVDVEPDTLTIDPEKILAVLSPATKAIMPVHLYGHPADMDAILEIAKDQQLLIVEDCAQAHGARYKGRRCGSMGDAAGFSFYFSKNLGAYGEGGFVTTRHADVAQRIREFRHHGQVNKSQHARIGYNLRLDELQAAVLRLKLRHLEDNNLRRAAIARRYDDFLADCSIHLLSPRKDCQAVYHLYPIRIENRDALREHLTRQSIGTGIHYAVPAHKQPALRDVPHRMGDMSVTEATCPRLLSLPMYPELPEEQVAYVAGHVRSLATKRSSEPHVSSTVPHGKLA